MMIEFIEGLNGLNLLDWIGISVTYLIVFAALRMLWFLIINRQVSRHTLRYSQPFKGGKRILILGDSTAVGAGTTRPENSIAGKLGRDLPTCEIRNVGQNGARTRDVLAQIKEVENERFDFAIISIGGNDVWHLTPLKSLEYSLMLVIDEVNRLSNNHTLFLIYSNIGSAPLFPAPLRTLLKKRAEKIRRLFMRITDERGAFAINLSTNSIPGNKQHAESYYAEDKIHPSEKAYHIWYKDIWRYIAKDNLVCDISDRPVVSKRSSI